MPRRRLIAANWKMNKAIAEAVAFVPPLRAALPRLASLDLAIFPSYLAIRPLADALQGTPVAVGAQNIHWEPAGAFTGEVSGPMARDAGATMVLIGHSERRHLMGESDDMVSRKLASALRHGLRPVLCVGETLEERDTGHALAVVERQLSFAFLGVPAALAERIVVAYEPVWAIGTGRTASPDDAAEMHAAIRDSLTGKLGTAADGMRILYGGSVKPDNAGGLIARESVDGFLIGGASLEPASYIAIAEAAVE